MTVCRYTSGRSQVGQSSWGAAVSGVDVKVAGRLVRFMDAVEPRVSGGRAGWEFSATRASDCGASAGVRTGSACGYLDIISTFIESTDGFGIYLLTLGENLRRAKPTVPSVHTSVCLPSNRTHLPSR